jgi:hypothetical protein
VTSAPPVLRRKGLSRTLASIVMTLCVSLDAVTTIAVILTRLDSDVDDDIASVRNAGDPALEDGYICCTHFI